MKFEYEQTEFNGIVKVKRRQMGDERGFFSRLWCIEQLKEIGWTEEVLQVNHSYSKKTGTVRGLHYQTEPYREKKFVTCLKGAISDVIVDVRENSETFLKHIVIELSESNCNSLIVPEGFAHGFQTLTDDTEIIYLVSNQYSMKYEKGLNPLDPRLNIEWTTEITDLSERDKSHEFVNASFKGERL